MEQEVLIKKGIKKHKGTLIAISILLFLIFFSIIVAITIYQNAGNYISQQMNRLGYGNITAWVSNVNNLENLKTEIESVEDVEKVEIQKLIFSGYSVNGTHSDNEGQLLKGLDKDYYIINNNMTDYTKIEEIKDNEIYISPSMKSSYQIEIGDTIEFEISRTGQNRKFIVTGYFEDPFMGSSMIDMKSFLISSNAFDEIEQEVNMASNTDILAENGAMLHIYQNKNSSLKTTEFNMKLNTHTNLTNYTEFVYTNETIYGFMMVLENILIGLLTAFVLVLIIVSIIIIAHSISNTIDNDKNNIAILKTIGFTNIKLRIIQVVQYTTSILIAIILAVLIGEIALKQINKIMITSTGLIIPTNISIITCITLILLIVIILLIIIIKNTSKISEVKPIEILNGERISKYDIKEIGEITKSELSISIAIRQLLSEKKKYIGVFVISILLTFFILLVGRLDSWVGKNGEGLMNTFSVADHDIGVQPLRHIDMKEIQKDIEKYSEIQSVYAVAMQPVSVNGVDLTANVLNDTSLLHILSGRTCKSANEIVITDTVAKELGVDIGDKVTIIYERKYQEFEIVGIYQCANEMGANIGMSREGFETLGNVNSYIWCYHFILSNSTHNEEIMKDLQGKYPMQIDVHTNSWSGLDGIVRTIKLLIIFMYIIVGIFIFIIVWLTSNKILYAEQKDMGIYKTLGFTSNKLRLAYGIRFLIISFLGALFGTILSTIFADKTILLMLRTFGIGEFNTSISLENTFIPMIVITLLFGMFAYITSRKIKKVSLINLIKD